MPDLSMGIKFEALISALSQSCCNDLQARQFFDYLRAQYTSQSGKVTFQPTDDLDLTFPFAIVSQTSKESSKKVKKIED